MKNKLEILAHLLFWVFILLSINIDWTADWFDMSNRPNTPAPMSLIVFMLFFYINAFVLIPRYFSIDHWKKYLFFSALLFLVPEIVRSILYGRFVTGNDFSKELFSRDSFLFGPLNVSFLAITLSFLYRLIRDRFTNNKKIKELEQASQSKKNSVPYQDQNILNESESKSLTTSVIQYLESTESYLDPDYSLRKLATSVQSTEKKVSYLLNQHMKTNFFELINKYRVEKFRSEISKDENKHLSIIGVALNCGFPSKSSFYRAFKSKVGLTPSEYIKKMKKADKH